MDTTMTLDDYRKLVEQVMRETLSSSNDTTPRIFTNIGCEHASIVIGTMLDYAQDEVRAYSDKLSKDVWDAEKIRNFIVRVPTSRICVIVDRADSVDCPESALSSLRDLISSGHLEVRQAQEKRPPVHVCVTDRKHVRLERDAASRKAVVSFGDSKLGAAAVAMFDECWSRSVVTPVTMAT